MSNRGRPDVGTGELVFTSKTIFSIISPLKNNLNESYSLFLIEFKIKILYDIIFKILKKYFKVNWKGLNCSRSEKILILLIILYMIIYI